MARYSIGNSPSVSLVCASALWAVATVISKKLLTSVPPITLLVVQLAPSVLLLWFLTILKGGLRPRRRSLAPLALIGVLNPGLAYTLSMLGLTRTTANDATLVWAAEPIVIVALAWLLLLREPVTRRLPECRIGGAVCARTGRVSSPSAASSRSVARLARASMLRYSASTFLPIAVRVVPPAPRPPLRVCTRGSWKH
jgi:hypothetical protein